MGGEGDGARLLPAERAGRQSRHRVRRPAPPAAVAAAVPAIVPPPARIAGANVRVGKRLCGAQRPPPPPHHHHHHRQYGDHGLLPAHGGVGKLLRPRRPGRGRAPVRPAGAARGHCRRRRCGARGRGGDVPRHAARARPGVAPRERRRLGPGPRLAPAHLAPHAPRVPRRARQPRSHAEPAVHDGVGAEHRPAPPDLCQCVRGNPDQDARLRERRRHAAAHRPRAAVGDDIGGDIRRRRRRRRAVPQRVRRHRLVRSLPVRQVPGRRQRVGMRTYICANAPSRADFL